MDGLRSLLRAFRGDRAPNPPVAVHGIRLGPIVVLGFGLELYHSLQAPVLASVPAQPVWLVSLVGGMGYAPDRAARERAGYAADFIPLILGELPFSDIEKELPAALIRLANRLAE